MAKKVFVFSLFVLLLASIASADVELWSTDSFSLAGSGWNIIPEFRIRNNLSELYYFQTYFGPSFPINPTLKLNALYGLKYSKSGGGWNQANFGYLDLVGAFTPFTNRFRLEYDLTNSLAKYRNQLQLKLGQFGLSDEFFYNLSGGFVDENRFNASYLCKLGGTDLAVGYLWRGQRSAANRDWVNSGAVTINSGWKI